MATRIAMATALVATSYAMYSRFHKREKDTTKSALEWLKGSPRLPKFAIPKCYDVELRPDLKACKFDGNLAVTLDITESTSCLVLNVFDITIKENSVHLRIKGNQQVLEPILIHIEKEDEILVLTFERYIPLGEATLYMEFQGLLNDHMKGFYRSSYVIDGESRNMAVTQFEPADARRCFPCWDEPSFKATFKLTLQVPTDRVVLSNMPVEEEKVDGSTKVVSFMESPKMSTYLVAVVVGELDYIESVTTGGSIVRVYFEPGKQEQGKFALDIATKSLPFYEKYFGTAYPLPKLDMVAIPDFAAGAMENYGLVTYREAALLFDGNNSSAANKQRVAIVVAHELAHQWFGNLVTMEWWTHLWLNEGFATWVSYLAVDHLFPEWNIWTQFIDQTGDALRLDGLVESHPIEVEVGHVREIDEIFDAISYKKGASIIRMLQNYLGPDRFQKGLVSYIKQFEYKNASTEDLWTVLAEESGEPVIELMNSWTKQQGYPVLTVRKKDNILELEQSQYLSSGLHGSGEWIVPVIACFGSYEVIATSLLWGKEGKIDLPSKTPEASESSNFKKVPISETSKGSATKWVKLNVGHPGFYRVQYDKELASGLRSAISSGALLATDRFGVLDDAYALCSACKQSLAELLSLMDVFRMETDYTVLSHLIGIAYKVVLVVSDAIPSAASDIKRFSARLFQFAAEKLGWDAKPEENHLDTMLRGEILLALVLSGHEETINEALYRFGAFVTDRKTSLLPPDIRNAAYQAVMQRVTSSDKSYYNLLLKIYKEANLSQERARILTKMASSPDPAVVLEALNFCLSSEVRNQDSVYVLSGISTEGREASWLWLKENWDLIYKRWGEGFLITRFISAITSQFSSDMKAEEIRSFFATHGNASIQRTVNQNIEKVHITAQWVKHICKENGLEEFVRELSSRSY